MTHITRIATSTAISVALLITPAVGAVVTHEIGASSSDSSEIEAAVTASRHGEPATIEWYIAVEGPYAVAFDGCGPGACSESQLVRQNGRWVVTCYAVEGKGRFGTCGIPAQTEEKLRHQAISLYHGP